MKKNQALQLVALCVLFLVTIFVWYAVFDLRGEEATISFLDVGQGDAIFIETPGDSQVLVDGGAGPSVIRGLSKEMPFFDRSIDLVIATHPDKDHIGGLIDVFGRYRVHSFLHSGNKNDTAVSDELDDRVGSEGSRVILARAGQVVDFDDGSYLRVFFPDRDVSDSETNAASVVLQYIYEDTEVFLSGDAPVETELYLALIYGEALDSDIFKLGHHGSDTSNSAVLLSLVSPESAVVSASCDNRYGHPHQEVLSRLSELSIETLSTCKNGTITFVSDGKVLTLK